MTVTIPYTPRPLQKRLHEQLGRFNVLVCHRRFGKTVFCVNEIIKKALINTRKRPQYAYIAPTMKQAKLIAWDYVKQYTRAIPHMKYNESELKCTFPNGAKLFVLGAENPDSLRGLYLDGVVLDEVAQMPSQVWSEVIRPTLADRKGWAIFIGTPKGQNFFYDIYQKGVKLKDWHTVILKASETFVMDPKELQAQKEEMGKDVYDQEFECSFTAAIQGTYYGHLIEQADQEGRIKNIAWEPSMPVCTAWDIGLDTTSIWFFQNIVGEIRIIDYYQNTEPLPHYVKVVKDKPYIYDYHILPHDSKHRSYETGKTRLEQFRKLGLKCRVAPKYPIKEGIIMTRAIIPMCYFDKDKCNEGLVALRNYRAQFNEKQGIFLDTPLHDKFSHGADAFRYLASGMKKYTNKLNRNRQSKIRVNNFDPFDF